MDTGEGTFKMFESMKELLEERPKYPKAGGSFFVGQRLEINGSLFEVSKLINNGLKLKLLKREEVILTGQEETQA